jgi:hypothetical protein
VGRFDDPAAGAPAGDAELERYLLVAGADVRGVAVLARKRMDRRCVVAAVE